MISPQAPKHTFWNLERSAQAFGSAIGTMPPLGLLTIASYLPDDFEIRFVDRNIRKEHASDWEWADVVFLSLMLVQRDDYRLLLDLAQRADVPIAVGGPYTSAMPEQVEREADWVCLGEAEDIMDSFVSDVRADRRGVVYHGGNKTDLEAVRVPLYELIDRPDDYYVMPLQYSRGCPFACEFCDIIEIYGRVPRTKSPAQVIGNLEAIHRTGFRGAIFVVDDNFIGNPKAAELMLSAVVDWNAKHDRPFFYFTEASVNLGDHPSLLDTMAAADFIFVFIGIETPDFDLLRLTKKYQNTRGDLLERLRTIRAHGIHIIAGMITGFDGESHDVFERQRAFVEESGIGVVTFGLLQALPNTALWRRLESEGRLLSDQSVSLNHTAEAMNFVPNGALSARRYLELLVETTHQLFDPEAFFRRTVRGLLDLQKRTQPPLKLRYAVSMIRVIFRMGIIDADTRVPFWRALATLLFHNKNALGAFYYDCFHFYHLNHHKHEITRSIHQHLDSLPTLNASDEKLALR